MSDCVIVCVCVCVCLWLLFEQDAIYTVLIRNILVAMVLCQWVMCTYTYLHRHSHTHRLYRCIHTYTHIVNVYKCYRFVCVAHRQTVSVVHFSVSKHSFFFRVNMYTVLNGVYSQVEAFY